MRKDMNIKRWKWLKEYNFINESQGKESNRARVFVRTINFDLRQLVVLHPSSEKIKTVSLVIELDVTPALSSLTDPSVFLGRDTQEVASFTNMLKHPFIYPIQQVSVLDDGFQGLGWPGVKKYPLDIIDEKIEEEVNKRFLPWFAQRSTFEQLVALLKEGDLALQKEIDERFRQQEAQKNFFQKLLSGGKKPSGYRPDKPSDGVANKPMRNALLAALYYAHKDIEMAKIYTQGYWSGVLK